MTSQTEAIVIKVFRSVERQGFSRQGNCRGWQRHHTALGYRMR